MFVSVWLSRFWVYIYLSNYFTRVFKCNCKIILCLAYTFFNFLFCFINRVQFYASETINYRIFQIFIYIF